MSVMERIADYFTGGEGEPVPAEIVARLDQMSGAVTNLAQLVGHSKSALLEAGMPEDQAFILTRDYWNILIHNNAL